MKLLICLPILLLSTICFSQIEQIEIKSKNENSVKKSIPYDSTDFINYDNSKSSKILLNEYDVTLIRRFIGQEVLILPKSHKYSGSTNRSFLGYREKRYMGRDFYCTLEKPLRYKRPTNIYKPIKEDCKDKVWNDENMYNDVYSKTDLAKQGITLEEFKNDLDDCDYVSDYFSLAAKKFIIVDLVQNGSYYKLVNEENGDTIYYYTQASSQFTLKDRYKMTPPLLVVGYIEKLKTDYLDKEFVLLYKDFNKKGQIDNITGHSIDFTTSSEWKCTKITLADCEDYMYQKITFLLDNSTGNEIAIDFEMLKKNFVQKEKYLKQIEDEREKVANEKAEQERIERVKANEEKQGKLAEMKRTDNIIKEKIASEEIRQKRTEDLVKKYGKEFGSIIADEQVKIGMSKEMCTASLGKPIDVNKQNSVLEKWIYKNKNLYFDKSGKLIAVEK